MHSSSDHSVHTQPIRVKRDSNNNLSSPSDRAVSDPFASTQPIRVEESSPSYPDDRAVIDPFANTQPIRVEMESSPSYLDDRAISDHFASTQPIRVKRGSNLSSLGDCVVFDHFASTQPIRVERESDLSFFDDRSVKQTVRDTIFIEQQIILLLYLIGITIAELLTTTFYPSIGVSCHALVMAGLFIHSALTGNRTLQRMLLTLSLAPLIRIVSLSLPLQDYSNYLWYLLVGAPLFFSAFLVARNIDVRPSDIGLSLNGWFGQIFISFIGIGLGYIEYLILRPQPLVDTFTFEKIWLPGIILIVFTGLLEEVIFRGLMQNAFVNAMGKVQGLLYVAVVFAVLHLGYLSLMDVIFVFSVSLLFGVISLRTRSILGVTLAHGVTNFCLFLVFPFLIG